MAYGLYLNTRSHKVLSMFPYAIVHYVKKELLLLILWSFFFLKKSTLRKRSSTIKGGGGGGRANKFWGRAAIVWVPIWGGLKFSEPAFRGGLQFSGRLWAMCAY